MIGSELGAMVFPVYSHAAILVNSKNKAKEACSKYNGFSPTCLMCTLIQSLFFDHYIESVTKSSCFNLSMCLEFAFFLLSFVTQLHTNKYLIVADTSESVSIILNLCLHHQPLPDEYS